MIIDSFQMIRAQSGGGSMTSHRCLLSLLVTLSVAALCNAGPLGPLSNVTSSDIGSKEGSCALGDVVYMVGDEFPGAGPCERCSCQRGGVRCERTRCHPRPGCKAVHRPDHCCPTYQCECEQEGRVYGNGEKLVDPKDPCRVCYCQGGEVVCRRIACFVRDDCKPRLVPGRCCPEYDNCPLRGVTTVPGVSPSYSTVEEIESSPVPTAPKEIVKQEITIKEITPVSEIPVITDVKIKEILPQPSIEVAEYSSSKSPLIVREATTEKAVTNDPEIFSKTEAPVIIEVHSSSSPASASSLLPEVAMNLNEAVSEKKTTNDSPPSKISLSTQDSINSEIYPTIMATMGSPSIIQEVIPVSSTTKPSIIEEEDSSFFEHNPAFPPIPDDLSQINNHEEEMVSEQNVDVEHISMVHEEVSMPSATPSTETVIVSEPLTTTPQPVAKTAAPTTIQAIETSTAFSTTSELSTPEVQSTISTEKSLKESPMLNLRSAIPTEILNVPSSVPEDITGELDDIGETTTIVTEATPVVTSTTTVSVKRVEEKYTEKSELPTEVKTSPSSTILVTEAETTTPKAIETTVDISSSQVPQQQTTNSIAKSDVATEITAQTELSSLPIETSDQNPHETSEILTKDQVITSTVNPTTVDLTTTKLSSPIETEVITVSRAAPTENKSFENVETTEFVLTSFGSSESATDAVELIKISAEPEKSAAIIETPLPHGKKNNVLTDLINLVGDVASMGDHTDSPDAARPVTVGHTSISDSEELIPVNAGYKSKNNNWNLNSITEVPVKSKSQTPANKQKVVEIEDEDTDNITDSPPPNDKVEPTTRRPIIDNVSDDMPQNKTEKKDIEIITKSYVPTINRRPTKVVMKKSNEPASEETSATEHVPVSMSSEAVTESDLALSSETATAGPDATSDAEAEVESEDRIAEAAPALEASEAQ